MGFVFIAHFPTSAWQSNCYLIATKEAAECVIVDPGPQSFARVKQLVRDHQLAPQGVLLTHGHVDHVADAAAVAAEYGIPVWIHPHDQELLSNPLAGLGQSFSHFLQQTLGTTTLTPPKDVRDLVGQESLKIAGISFDITHAPGHSRGCALLGVNQGDDPFLLTGDVVFAGSVGRTDLTGSDPIAMATTLATMVATVPAGTILLPGHGPATSMARECATNPYLKEQM